MGDEGKGSEEEDGEGEREKKKNQVWRGGEESAGKAGRRGTEEGTSCAGREKRSWWLYTVHFLLPLIRKREGEGMSERTRGRERHSTAFRGRGGEKAEKKRRRETDSRQQSK